MNPFYEGQPQEEAAEIILAKAMEAQAKIERLVEALKKSQALLAGLMLHTVVRNPRWRQEIRDTLNANHAVLADWKSKKSV